MDIREDRWLSSIFGHGVFKIEVENDGEKGSSLLNVTEQVASHASQQSHATYYARVDTSRIGKVLQLGAAGLYVVETSVRFRFDPGSPRRPPQGEKYFIGEILPEQRQEVLDIAATCFQYSRFHLDPFIPDTIANQVKHDWVMSYIGKERGEQLLVASIDGRPVGFLAVLAATVEGKRAGIIDLIGVSRAFQNRGVGKALVEFFIQEYEKRCDFLEVGTQAANIPSIRLYQALNFYIVKSQYAMHMHVRNGTYTWKPNGNR